MVNSLPNIVKKKITRLILYLMLVFGPMQLAIGQLSEGPIEIFGYYQNSFEYNALSNQRDYTTFMTQQLNLIVQKDLAAHFRSFVNFEFLNTFDGSLGWGSASLKEAWVRYDAGHHFKLKLGLQLPVFNALNEIKTRSPLLPYIVRPIVYETSLKEIVNIEEYVPEQAFVQAYGVFPVSHSNLEYAVFLGNSPNVNNDITRGQTGVDTTRVILVGGRLGINRNTFDSGFTEFGLGISATYDRVNNYIGVPALFIDDPVELARAVKSYEDIPRWRVGGDFSVYWNRLYLKSEVIAVRNKERNDILDIDRTFYYGTLGIISSERSELYVTYWATRERGVIQDRQIDPDFFLDQKANLDIYSFGAKYILLPRVVLKAQYAYVDIRLTERLEIAAEGIALPRPHPNTNDRFSVYALAVSVFF